MGEKGGEAEKGTGGVDKVEVSEYRKTKIREEKGGRRMGKKRVKDGGKGKWSRGHRGKSGGQSYAW